MAKLTHLPAEEPGRRSQRFVQIEPSTPPLSPGAHAQNPPCSAVNDRLKSGYPIQQHHASVSELALVA